MPMNDDTGGLDPQGEARQALAAAVKDYGPGVLSNPSLLGNLFKDLLPGAPREASLLVAAAEAGASSMLEQQVAGVGPDAAVRTDRERPLPQPRARPPGQPLGRSARSPAPWATRSASPPRPRRPHRARPSPGSPPVRR